MTFAEYASIYLIREPMGRLHQPLDSKEKGVDANDYIQ